MPAKECREHALHCEQLAETVPTLTGRQIFLNLARSWRRLAAELEHAQSFLALVDGMTFDWPGERGLNKSVGGPPVSH
jgi:hypothetical protein